MTIINDVVFLARNIHTRNCGRLFEPFQNAYKSVSCYLGYFQNEHGEQWLFRIVKGESIAAVRGGDISWVTEATYDGFALRDSDGVILVGVEEMAWLQLCWITSAPWRVAWIMALGPETLTDPSGGGSSRGRTAVAIDTGGPPVCGRRAQICNCTCRGKPNHLMRHWCDCREHRHYLRHDWNGGRI